MSQWRDSRYGKFNNAFHRTNRSRIRTARIKSKHQLKLEAEGYTVYTNGWPNIAAEKDGKVRFFVVNPIVTEIPVVLGRNKDRLSEAFKRWFGVEFEILADPKEESDDISKWV